ncbi:class I SAM-dependent methyltransferase [Candidatus Roizmanbacteria bacterium]|nr:class I SAM-dependent methyltransferase [Candidatus Roizmanbacteria bacterium]
MDYQNRKDLVKRNFRFAYDYIFDRAGKNKNKILEIGAGFGYFLRNFDKRFKCDAVEVSKEAIAQIKRNSKAKVYEGNFLDIGLRDKYDFIAGFDVIEHQIFLSDFLIKVRKLLKENGRFIFTTPDFGSKFNKILGRRAPVIQTQYHNYYLSQDWIKKNLPKIGFELVSIRTVNSSFMDLGYILVHLSLIFPWFRRTMLFEFIRKSSLSKLIFPFLRFGGIECVVRKI